MPVDRLAALPAGHVLPARPGRLPRRDARRPRRSGVVRDVEGTLTGSRLVVDGDGGEVLIPLVAAICTAIDPAAKRIVIDPPDGLLEVNARG